MKNASKFPESAELTEADKDYITNLYENAEEGWNQGDREPYLARLAQDVRFMAPNSKIKMGYEAVKEYVYSFPEIVVDLNVIEIFGNSSFAGVRGDYKIHDKNGQVLDEGKFLNVLQKNSEGNWLTTQDMHNSDLPLPEVPIEELDDNSEK